jgi:hypothetical protein
MKSGAINIVAKSGQSLSSDAVPLERQEDGHDLRSTIQHNGHAQSTLGDMSVNDGSLEATKISEGTILREELVDVKTKRINGDGRPEIYRTDTEVQVDETRFIFVEDQILLTERTEADAARKTVETITEATIREARIDLKGFTDAHPEFDSVLDWGDERDGDFTLCVIGDSPTAENIRKQLDSSNRVQVSFQNLKWEGCRLFGTITESGYVEIYRDENGGRFGTEEFTRFVLEEVIPHAEVVKP